jgi:hypothetical protein
VRLTEEASNANTNVDRKKGERKIDRLETGDRDWRKNGKTYVEERIFFREKYVWVYERIANSRGCCK